MISWSSTYCRTTNRKTHSRRTNREIENKPRENFKFSVPITHSLNVETKPIPEQDPMEEVKVASLDNSIKPNLEDDAQFFIEEDKSSIEPKPLDELKEPPSPSLSLNPCLLVLDMLFSIMIRILL